MKRTATLLASLALALGLGVGMAPAAEAEGEGVMPLLASNVMCVKPDFPVTGSGWRVHAAVAAWNDAQSVIRLTTVNEPGCSPVYVHRYNAQDDMGGYTTWEHGHETADGGWQIDGADIYLNDFYNPGGSKYWSRHIVAHELGHAMGLSHVDSTRSVMTEDATFNKSRPLIGRVDVWALAALYR